jgi:hypothetical protein
VNWGEVLYWSAAFIAGTILLSAITGVIANAVIKTKKASSYRAELDVPGRAGSGGKIHVALDSEAELIKFLQRYSQDIIRWSESPDRVKR